MLQADLSYQPVCDAAGLPISASIFADRPDVLGAWREDAELAGMRIAQAGALVGPDGGAAQTLGDIVLVDCPQASGAALAALARIDLRVARSGAALVVATSEDALEPVFGCLDQSRAEILVDPSRGERVVALGRMMAGKPRARLRDLGEEERLTLLRLTEQIGEIAERLERLGQSGLAADGGAFRFESPNNDYRGPKKDDQDGDRLVRKPRPPLPDPRLVRRIIRQRQLRTRFFDPDLFADPAWDILLDLTAARAEHQRVSVTSLCIASGVPSTTALRWIGQMVEAGLLDRIEDDTDKRRAFIALSDKAAEAMARYFDELGKEAATLG